MPFASVLALQAQAGDQAFRAPAYFELVFVLLLAGGALAWLVAAALGFSRARTFGASARWFALAALCMIIYHLHFVLVGFGVAQRDNELVLALGAFLNLFVFLSGVCAILGFARLTDPRP